MRAAGRGRLVLAGLGAVLGIGLVGNTFADAEKPSPMTPPVAETSTSTTVPPTTTSTTTSTTVPPTTTTSRAPATTRVTPTLPPLPTAAPRSTTAPPGGCHPSYAGACLPANASDVDCAGGSGNGPVYTSARNIRVVGPDVFDLDRDGDGLGCDA